MLKNLLIISTFYVAALASSRLTIVHSPKSLDFKGNDRLNSESLADVFAASLGFSVTHPSEWKGLYVNDPFSPAEGVVAVAIEGVNKFGHVENEKTNSYDLVGSGTVESLDSLVFRVREHNAEVMDLDLSQGLYVSDQFGDFKPHQEKIVSSLKSTNVEDKSILQQISIINYLAEYIQSMENLPKLITIRVSLAPLIAAHSIGSPAVTDSLKLLQAAVENLFVAADKAYKNGVVTAVVTINDDVNSRNKRATSTKSDPIPEGGINLAMSYNADYPVIFNIILWFGVVLTFTLLSISYTIGYMDPGRDSIIYRMTSTRMKKDN